MFSQSLQAKAVYEPLGKGEPAATAQQVGSCLGELGLYKSGGWRGLAEDAKRFGQYDWELL